MSVRILGNGNPLFGILGAVLLLAAMIEMDGKLRPGLGGVLLGLGGIALIYLAIAP